MRHLILIQSAALAAAVAVTVADFALSLSSPRERGLAVFLVVAMAGNLALTVRIERRTRRK